MHEIEIAVVILNWNGKSFFELFLPTLIEHTNKQLARIYVIDNASTDRSVEYLTTYFPDIPVIVLDKNYGFTGGYNKGLATIKSKYFLLLNSDIEVPKYWLEPLYHAMEQDQSIGVIAPKLLNYYVKDEFEYAGAAGGYIDKHIYPFCRGRIFEHREKDNKQYEDLVNCFWVSGAAFMIRSELFFLLQGFDDNFFAHQEEIDLCWRVQNAGYRIVCEPKSTVYHVGGGTLPKSNPFKTYLNFRNNLLMIDKNLVGKVKYKILIIRFFLDMLAAFRMLLQKNVKDCQSVIKAYLYFIKNRNNKANQNLIKQDIRKMYGYYNHSIVITHFLKRKTKFNELNF